MKGYEYLEVFLSWALPLRDMTLANGHRSRERVTQTDADEETDKLADSRMVTQNDTELHGQIDRRTDILTDKRP